MKNVTLFFKEVKSELQKVVWPKKAEFGGAFVIVLLVLGAFTLYFGVINKIFQVGILRILQFFAVGRS